jgi:hypothetical protein
MLIPVNYLVNYVSIAQTLPECVSDIEYFHIELETHEVIFAEGAEVESLLVGSDREGFDNFVEYERLYGVDQSVMTPYAPICSYPNGRSELGALLRRMASPVADLRDAVQIAYDKIATRALELAA